MSSNQSKDSLVNQVKLSPNGKLLAISTPERVSIYSTTENESNLKASIKTLILPDPPRTDPTLDPSSSQPIIAFPRCLAFSPDSNRLAITGDDKSIRIWDISQVKNGELVGLGYGNQILHQNIPKRASMIGWEGNETIIVADKFGDVRSFTIGSAPTSAPARQKSSEQPPAKKAKTEPSEIEEEEEGEGEEEEGLDSSLKPHLGHVSFLTSFVLAGKSPKDSSPRHILTADRDGHIRISRWGSRKAAWVTENFLLGSRGCVGSILLIPSSSGNDENLLLSSDGGSSLNLWNYLAPAGKKQRISTCIVKDALIDHIAVCPEREKCKENRKLDENGRFKGSNKKSGKVKSQENGTSNEETIKVESSEEIVDPKRAKDLAAIKSAKQDLGRVITSLRSFKSKSGETFILFTAEGSTSFFHLPLSSILEISSSTDFSSPIIPEKDLSSLVVATETGAPILSLDLTESSQDGSIKVWTASDTRKGARLSKDGIRNELWKKVEGDGGELEIQSLGLDCFDFDGKKFSKMDSSSQSPEGSILRSVHELTRESREATYGASTLDLYPALLWPKLSPEIHNLQWTIQNDEASKKGKGTKPKFNKQKMRDGHKEVIENGRKWLEERKA